MQTFYVDIRDGNRPVLSTHYKAESLDNLRRTLSKEFFTKDLPWTEIAHIYLVRKDGTKVHKGQISRYNKKVLWIPANTDPYHPEYKKVDPKTGKISDWRD